MLLLILRVMLIRGTVLIDFTHLRKRKKKKKTEERKTEIRNTFHHQVFNIIVDASSIYICL